MREIALISVYDKEGVGTIARALADLGMEIVATGKTRSALEAEGLKVKDITDLTNEPERFGGRVKTLHHAVMGGVLFRPERDESEWPYDFRIKAVVCNFYPFQEKADECHDLESLMEWVDIGGPTLVRAAAKNHPHVFVFTRPDQYTRFIAAPSMELPVLRERLALEAFELVEQLDSAIAAEFQWHHSPQTRPTAELNYGENPHQKAHFSPNRRVALRFFGNFSYNNVRDAEGALRFVLPFKGPAVGVVKHQTLCGASAGTADASKEKVFDWAWEGDTVSRYGGILAFNFLPTPAITAVLAKKFIEVLIVPKVAGAEEWAEKLHQEKSRLRIILVDETVFGQKPKEWEVHSGLLGKLTQEMDFVGAEETDLNEEGLLMAFGQWAAACSKSNAMVLVGDDEKSGCVYLAGAGQGQPNRVDALEKLALPRAAEFAKRREVDMAGLTCFSDAFIPFEDSLHVLKKAGVKKLVQPGGSKSDDEIADAARKLEVSMIITGQRHFWH